MAVKTGTAVGEYISPHIKDTEWKCRASNAIKYDETELVMLEKMRSDFGASAIIIESGYRTKTYNAKIGGASDSPHIKGYAADVRFIKDGKLIPSEIVCCHAQDIGFKGVAICGGFGINAHLDMYPARIYRGDERKGNYGNNIRKNDWYQETGLTKADVQKYLVEDDEMDQKEFNKMADNYFVEKAKEAPAPWSADARKFVEDNDIFNGDSAGDMHYKSPCTREELAQVLYGMAAHFEANGSDKDLVDAIKAISVPLEAIAKSKED